MHSAAPRMTLAASIAPERARTLASALGTLLRRLDDARPVALSRDAAVPPPLRDALVQGLLLTGVDVVDVGVVDGGDVDAACGSGALARLGAKTHLHLARADDGVALALMGDALPADAARRVDEIAARGDFAAGEGLLTLGVRAASPRAPRAPSAQADEATTRMRASTTSSAFLDEDTEVDA